MFERFAKPARAAVVEAVACAQTQQSPAVGCEHLLIGLATSGEPTLAGMGITAETLTARLVDGSRRGGAVGDRRGPRRGPRAGRGQLRAAGLVGRADQGGAGRAAWPAGCSGITGPFTAAAKKSLELALREALADSSREITGTHLLRGLLRAPGDDLGRIIDAPTIQTLRDRSRPAA